MHGPNNCNLICFLQITPFLNSLYNHNHKLSRSEICVANFIPPCEWCKSRQQFSPKKTVLGQKQAKWGQPKQLWHPNMQTFIDEVILLQTDSQTNSWTPYTGVCGFFLQVKFATSLLASLAGGLLENYAQFQWFPTSALRKFIKCPQNNPSPRHVT